MELITSITTLGSLLETCSFRQFWTTLAPQREELALLERYVNEVLWGQVRETAGIFRSNVSVSLRVCWPELVLTARRFQEQALKK